MQEETVAVVFILQPFCSRFHGKKGTHAIYAIHFSVFGYHCWVEISSCKNEESISQRKGCHKAGPCSSLDYYTSPHVNNDIIIHDLLMMNKFLREQTTSMGVLQMGYLNVASHMGNFYHYTRYYLHQDKHNWWQPEQTNRWRNTMYHSTESHFKLGWYFKAEVPRVKYWGELLFS
jgi:hypothetical protein